MATLEKVTPRKWQARFDQRQKQTIEFSRLYVSQFNHGADGHNAMQIIAEMSYILDAFDGVLKDKTETAERLEKENKELRSKLAELAYDFDATKDSD